MSDQPLIALLSGHQFMTGLPGGTGAVLAECARPQRFAAGDFLLREGGTADAIYLITLGHVAIEIHSPIKGGIVIDKVGPGHVVGLSWVAPPYRWQFDARALEPVETITVDVGCLRERLDLEPEIAAAFHRRLSANLLERLQATRIRLLDLYGNVRD
ncbi:MAG TPA: cyclic nucleotide-binding domain-containing protein [Acidimicrobiales bacterium]|nr:cyclic nucleotide-binding domain-containing protein [Acidimicrobiales bacterium]